MNDSLEGTRDDDIEQLTAYLDGELNDAEIQSVEQRIANETKFRLEMQRLQRTWDLLEELPTEGPNASFTQTTMELVVDDAMREIKSRERSGWFSPKQLLLTLGLPIAVFVGSYWTVRQTQQSQLRALMDDLPVIERADQYLEIGQDFDFLQMLHQSKLFSDDSVFYSPTGSELSTALFTEGNAANGSSVAPVDDMLARFEQMDAAQQDSLRRKRERFEALPSDEQDLLRDFHKQLSSHASSEGLGSTLDEYYQWLGKLSSSRRSELAGLEATEHVKAIRELMGRLARDEFGRAGVTQLPSGDARKVFDWYETTTTGNRASIVKQFANLVTKMNRDEGRRVLPKKLNELMRRPLNQLMGVLIRFDRDFVKAMLIKNVDALRAEPTKLSDEALEILDAQLTENAKQVLLLKWIEAANQTQTTIGVPQLQRFFETLSPEDRDELDKLSWEKWVDHLTRRYREAQLAKATPAADLSDEQGTILLIEESGLIDSELPEDNMGITDEDLGMPIAGEEDNWLPMEEDVELTVPDSLTE
jgi:hypothetical protein